MNRKPKLYLMPHSTVSKIVFEYVWDETYFYEARREAIEGNPHLLRYNVYQSLHGTPDVLIGEVFPLLSKDTYASLQNGIVWRYQTTDKRGIVIRRNKKTFKKAVKALIEIDEQDINDALVAQHERELAETGE